MDMPGGILEHSKRWRCCPMRTILSFSPCGFGIERTNEELRTVKLLESKEWQNLPAVKNGRVAISDGNKYFNRSSVANILETNS